MQIKAIEAFAYFTEPKKASQWSAMIAPTPIYFKINALGISFNLFPKPIKRKTLIDVINTRHQTSTIAESSIKFPKIAVSPAKRTAI